MNADFSERTYTAEVMKASVDPADAIRTVLRLTNGPRDETEAQETDGKGVRIVHTFVAAKREFHRVPRLIAGVDGREVAIPRRETIRTATCTMCSSRSVKSTS
jgi:hypothetical protein